MNQICPICNRSEFKIKYKIQSFVIVECTGCSLVILADPLPFEDIKNMYKKSYFKSPDPKIGYLNYFDNKKSLELTCNRRINRLINKNRGGLNILDVGTASGIFVKACKNHEIEAEGIEISEEAVKYANDILKVKVTQSTLEEWSPDKTFDLITAWDVIEHITNPNIFLHRITKLLKPGGRFIFSTGDIESTCARVSRSKWHLFNLPDHLFFYSPKTIRKILKQNGLKVVSISYPYSYYTLSYLTERFLKKVVRINNVNFIKAIAYNRLFASIAIPFNLFDIMEVIAIRG